MFKADELANAPEYWLEKIQNGLYRELVDYLEKNEMSQVEFAQKLGVSKAYVSQIMNGRFNYTLIKLIELALAIEKVPDISFSNKDEYVASRKQIKLNQACRVTGKPGERVISIVGQRHLTADPGKFMERKLA